MSESAPPKPAAVRAPKAFALPIRGSRTVMLIRIWGFRQLGEPWGNSFILGRHAMAKALQITSFFIATLAKCHEKKKKKKKKKTNF